MVYNVRRYVQLVQFRVVAPCPVPNAEKVGVILHSWCGAGLSGKLHYTRVGKNPRQVGAGCDTRSGSPAGAGAACATGHKSVLFSQKILAAQKAIAYTDLLY